VKIIKQKARRLLKGEATYSIVIDLNERGVRTAQGAQRGREEPEEDDHLTTPRRSASTSRARSSPTLAERRSSIATLTND